MVAWFAFMSSDMTCSAALRILCMRPHPVPIPLAITIKMDRTGDLFPVKRERATIKIPATLALFMGVREKVRKTTPVFSYKCKELRSHSFPSVSLCIGFGCLLLGKHCLTHAVDLGFAFTDYKVQGLTLDKLIIMFNLQGIPRHDLATVYVGISRLRRIQSISILG